MKYDASMGHSAGLGTLRGKRMHEHAAAEPAAVDSRWARVLARSDLDRLRQELTNDPPVDPDPATSDAAPESDGWTELPGSGGHRADTAPGEGEDAEGRSDNERLLIEGFAEFEHDQRRQAIARSGR